MALGDEYVIWNHLDGFPVASYREGFTYGELRAAEAAEYYLRVTRYNNPGGWFSVYRLAGGEWVDLNV